MFKSKKLQQVSSSAEQMENQSRKKRKLAAKKPLSIGLIATGIGIYAVLKLFPRLIQIRMPSMSNTGNLGSLNPSDRVKRISSGFVDLLSSASNRIKRN